MRKIYFLPLISIILAVIVGAPRLSFAQYQISTVAGGGPNNLPATKTSVGYPGGVALDSAGNTYIADSYSSQIFKVSSSGTLTVVAGNGTLGYSGDGGPATGAQLNRPESVFVDGSGNIFIADTDNSVIREVVASSGNIQTVAGSATLGSGYSGDGGPATGAQLNDPFGVFVDGSGNVFIADTDNCAIREVSGGNISTVAGSPGLSQPCAFAGDGGLANAAQLDLPQGITLDAAGNIYIADTDNTVIRVVNPGTAAVTIATVVIQPGDIQTVAGQNYNIGSGSSCQKAGDNGPATMAFLCAPEGVFVDGPGNIFIADTDNFGIREVVTAGTISTVAGILGTAGFIGDGGPATSAELNYPSGVVTDSSGDIFIADNENYRVREVTGGTINTIAGNPFLSYSGDGGPATAAALNNPGDIAFDASGDIFIADTDSSVIREVLASGGNIQTVAGNGATCPAPAPGGCGDGGPATSAQLNFPSGTFLDSSGNIYIADDGAALADDSVIRVVNTGSAAITVAGVVIQPGAIETVVGTLGTAGYTGDGGPATAAELSNPDAVLLDKTGNIYVADTGNSAVRVVNTGTTAVTIAGVAIPAGAIETVAGNGTACANPSAGCGDNGTATAAELNFPTSIALDASGDIVIADSFNNAIRLVNATTGIIQTVAGTLGTRGYSGDNGPPTSATLNTPSGIFIDSLGNLFIADSDNAAVREVVAVTNTIQTVAGTGKPGFSGDGGAATSAELNYPSAVLANASGTILIADTENSRVRQLSATFKMEIEPSSANVIVSGSQQFAANVTGAENTGVTWQVNGVTGGNASVGKISSSGLYQAPASVSTSSVTVRAISNVNGITSGSALTTLLKTGSPNVGVSSSPAGVTEVYTGTPQTFNAKVSGESNTAVDWQVNGVTSGNATYGTISNSGVYTGPGSVPLASLILITAVSQAQGSISGAYPVTIVTVPSATTPAPQTVSAGGSATYSITLNANTGSPKQPITLSCVQSSLPSGAKCSFSPTTITPSNAAVPFTLTVTVPATTGALQKPNSTRFPQLYLAFMPLTGILLMAGSSRSRKAYWLWLAVLVLLITLNGCGGGSSSGSSGSGGGGGGGGNSTSYTVQVQGTTTAQPNPVTITTAKLTVQ